MVNTCQTIRDDVEAYEYVPFNGANVSEMFGFQAAQIGALAAMVAQLAQTIQRIEAEL